MRITQTLLSLALALAAASCGRDDPQALLASAKQYIAKREYSASIIQLKNALQREPANAEARYLLGFSSLESGDLASAEVELAKAHELGLRSDELELALARTLLARGKADVVLAQSKDKVLSGGKAQAELQALLGMAHLRGGQPTEARDRFTKALAGDAANVTAMLGRALLAAADGDSEKALAAVDQAIAASPSHVNALVFKADLLASRKDKRAEEAYRAAVQAAPQQVGPRLSLISQLLRERELEKAATEVETLQKAAPKDPRTSFAMAMLLSEQGKYAQAREAIQQVLKVAPDHVPSLTLAGVAAFHTGALAEAEGHLRKAVAKSPDAVLARRTLAATRLRLGQTELALRDAKELLKDHGANPAVLALVGEAHLANGEVAAAARYYEQAQKLAPESTRLRTRLAQVRFATGDADRGFKELQAAATSDAADSYQADLALITAHLRRRQTDKALEALKALEKKQPTNPLTHNLRGLALAQKRDFSGARKAFERALELQPTYMPAVAGLARLDLRAKKPDAAKKRYEAVLAKEPNNEQAMLALAVLLRISGAKPQETEQLLKRAVSANPTSVNARTALVNFHLRNRNPKAALAAAQEAQAAVPGNPAVVQMLGLAQLAAGETRQALGSFQRLAELAPKSPQPHLHMARVHLAEKKPDEAIRALRAALAIQPDLASAHRDIAGIYMRTGRASEALAGARRLQKERPDQPLGYAMEGEIEIAQKNWDSAERVYRAAAKKFDMPLLAMRTHAVLDAAGKRAAAEAFAEDWMRSHPKDASMLEHLADSDLANKRYASAAKRYRMALDKQPDNARALNNLAWVANELKQPQALEHAERAHELAPDNAAVMDTLGWILTQRGERERGLELLARATEIAPEAPAIRLHLAKALMQAGRKAPARKELEALAALNPRHPVQQEAAALLKKL